MTIDPISDERLAEIRAGLEGVTPGPWRVCETHEGEIIGRPSWPCRRHGVNGEWRVAIADELDGAAFEQDANAAHIARLDPQTVAALLSRLDKAEAGWRRDVGILLANIRQIEDATGEGPEGEDAQILDQIEREYEALPPPPSES